LKNKRNIISTVILVVILLVGIGLLVYPTVSDWWNTKTQSRAIATYQQTVNDLTTEEYEKIIAKAREYNERLLELDFPLEDYEELDDYYDVLDVSGTGVMGYITIPQLNLQLPVYHGTSAEVLNIAIGHLQGTSLPVGGESTHAVVMAHRGLPSARLFSDLDQLVVGDTFTITVLNEVYTYEVDKISIVLPSETDELNIIEGGDYVTLVTCTPYGVNTHRLLVRAKRIENEEAETKVVVPADATQVDPMIVVPCIAGPLVLIMIIIWIFGGKKSKQRKNPIEVYK
jgi:sortase A